MPNWTDTAPTAGVACPLGCITGVRRRIVDTVWEAPEAAVYQCTNCDIVFIDPIMSEEDEKAFYEAIFAGYMKERGGPGETDPADHFEQNRGEAERRLANLMPYLDSQAEVLDLGSATGAVLAAIAPHVVSVTGVEPGTQYREHANERGIPTVADLDDVAHRRFDVIVAYYVVEHLRDPIGYLRRLHDMLKPGGRLAVEVPNVEDALVKYYQVDAFDRFYWQKAHYFNYSHDTMRLVLERVGFVNVEVIPEQRYDISNHVHWLWQGQPGGKGRYTDLLDEGVNREYARALKERWLCDTVFAVAQKALDA